MAIITKQWCGWGGTDGSGNDNGKVSYQYDDTVSAGFPHGKLTAFTWVNGSSIAELITLTLRPGDTGTPINVGAVTSIPLAVASATPVPNGATVQVGGVSFVANGNTAVGAAAIAVQSHSIGAQIPAGSQVTVPLPAITIPALGQTAPLPAFYGGGTVNPTGSVNLTAVGVPMIQFTAHGQNFVAVPADLTCTG